MKLIATDLDGTLLNEKGEISKENIQAIKKAMDEGIEFIVATGRSYDAACKPLHAAGLSAPVISLNGANTFALDRTMLHSISMEKPVAKKIQQLSEQKDIYIEFFTNNGIYSKSRSYFVEVMVDVMKTANPEVPETRIREDAKQRLQDEQVTFIENFDDLYTMKNLEVYKILGFSLEKEKLIHIHNQLVEEETLAITSSGAINIEFNHVDAQKGLALETVAKSMSIEMQDVMTLGDNFNDASMLQMAGRGVAMGNAEPEIKAMCNYTTKANDEHGVAVAIEEMLNEVKAGK